MGDPMGECSEGGEWEAGRAWSAGRGSARQVILEHPLMECRFLSGRGWQRVVRTIS
jgi:hypothetical protein